MSQKKDGLTVEQALGLAATDREELLERLHRVTPDTGWIPRGPSKWPTTPAPVRAGWRWKWQCLDPVTGDEIQSGHAPTKRWAMRRRAAAAGRIHDARPEAER